MTSRALLVAVSMSAGLLCSTAAPQGVDAPLAATLREQAAARFERIAGEADGVIGYAIVDVETGDRFTRLETAAFPTASTIKLGVLYELLKQADEGRVDLDHPTPLDRSHAVAGGLLYHLTTPSLSPRDLAVAMIVQSDNTATNVLIARLGMKAVNERMRALGLTGTLLRRHMIDLDAAMRGEENVATPADLAQLVLAFHRGEGLSARSGKTAAEILRIHKGTPIRTGVPNSVAIASKSGELEGVRADAGIVYVTRRPYVFVAMGTYLREPDADAPLRALAHAAYEYFSRLATISKYGRQIP